MLTTAKKGLPILFSFIFRRNEVRPLMAPVTKGLFLGFATRAPPVRFSRLHIDGDWLFLSDNRVRHPISPCLIFAAYDLLYLDSLLTAARARDFIQAGTHQQVTMEDPGKNRPTYPR